MTSDTDLPKWKRDERRGLEFALVILNGYVKGSDEILAGKTFTRTPKQRKETELKAQGVREAIKMIEEHLVRYYGGERVGKEQPLTMTIGEDRMTSDVTGHVAEWRPNSAANGRGAWVVTWLPTRLLDKNQAITAMSIAEEAEYGYQDSTALIAEWAAELHLTGDEAIKHLNLHRPA